MDIEEKTYECKVCKEMLPEVKFDKWGRGKIHATCKECYRQRRLSKLTERSEAGETKECASCKEVLAVSEFYSGDICKKCRNKQTVQKRNDARALDDALYKCPICGEEKPRTKFESMSMCIACRSSNTSGKLLYMKIKMGSKCEDCGFSDWRALDFAHYDRSTKYRNRHGYTAHINSLPTAKLVTEELLKGRFLCAWCHRHETYSNRPSFEKWAKTLQPTERIRIYTIVLEKFKRSQCVDCKRIFHFDSHSAFEFDHIPGARKAFGVSNGIAWCRPIDKIIEEMAKCEMVCVNCHRIRTHSRIQEKKRKLPSEELELEKPKAKKAKLDLNE